MSLKRALVPAVAGLVLFLGCDSKPKDPVALTAPTPITQKDPQAVLDHLRYMAVRKDLKHASAISLGKFDTAKFYGNIAWFHKHAGDLGVSLTAEEFKTFDLEALKGVGLLAPGVSLKELTDAKNRVALKTLDKLPAEMEGLSDIKLDTLPGDQDKSRKAEYDVVKPKMAAVADAGLYRLAKAMPDEVWRKVTVQAVKPNAGDAAWKDVFLQIGTKLILQITVAPMPDGNMGVIYMYYKVPVASLKKIEKALQEGMNPADIK